LFIFISLFFLFIYASGSGERFPLAAPSDNCVFVSVNHTAECMWRQTDGQTNIAVICLSSVLSLSVHIKPSLQCNVATGNVMYAGDTITAVTDASQLLYQPELGVHYTMSSVRCIWSVSTVLNDEVLETIYEQTAQ